MRPQNYREWIFLSSGLGMTYGALAAPEQRFDNIFVNRDAYRGFLETGHWPDQTILLLEVRSAESKGSFGARRDEASRFWSGWERGKRAPP